MSCRNCELLDQHYHELQAGFEALDRKFIAEAERVSQLNERRGELLQENARLREALEITRNELAEHQTYSCRPIRASVEWRLPQASADTKETP